jgi:hypothetical protein
LTARNKHGDPLAISAVLNGDGATLKLLVDNGLDIHKPETHGWNLAMLAVDGGHIHLLHQLDELGVVFSAKFFGKSPLSTAIKNEKWDMVIAILMLTKDFSLLDSYSLHVLKDHPVELGNVLSHYIQQNINENYISIPALQFLKAQDINFDFNQIPKSDSESSLMTAIHNKNWLAVSFMLMMQHDEKAIDPVIYSQLKVHRYEIASAFLGHLNHISNADEKRNLVLTTFPNQNKLGILLNTPENSLKFQFSAREYRGEKVTGTVYKIMEEVLGANADLQQSVIKSVVTAPIHISKNIFSSLFASSKTPTDSMPKPRPIVNKKNSP